MCYIAGHSAPITCLAVVPGLQPQVISGSLDASLKMWSVESGQCVDTFKAGSKLNEKVARAQEVVVEPRTLDLVSVCIYI